MGDAQWAIRRPRESRIKDLIFSYCGSGRFGGWGIGKWEVGTGGGGDAGRRKLGRDLRLLQNLTTEAPERGN
jgi:hypothetical protein